MCYTCPTLIATNGMMLPFFNFDRRALEAHFADRGEAPWRAARVMTWVYRRGVRDFGRMTDIAKPLRENLAAAFAFPALTIGEVHRSFDNTLKYRFVLVDGRAVEAVLIPGDPEAPDDDDIDPAFAAPAPAVTQQALYKRRPEAFARADGRPPRMRNTLCISSQVGCAMGCTFCFTATMGLIRHLEPWEIVAQLDQVNAHLAAERPPGTAPDPETTPRVTNIVFMGMGEPLHNFDGMATAARIMCDDAGFGLSARRVTVSTSGLVPKIPRLAAELPVSLAVSLNATTDEVREAIMPVNKAHPIAELVEALKAFPQPRRRRVLIEYVLLRDVNDTDDDAKRLAAIALDVGCKVNLIPFNPHPGSPFVTPPAERVLAFQRGLLNRGVQAFLRIPRGRDVYAACGMLADKRPDKPQPAAARA